MRRLPGRPPPQNEGLEFFSRLLRASLGPGCPGDHICEFGEGLAKVGIRNKFNPKRSETLAAKDYRAALHLHVGNAGPIQHLPPTLMIFGP